MCTSEILCVCNLERLGDRIVSGSPDMVNDAVLPCLSNVALVEAVALMMPMCIRLHV